MNRLILIFICIAFIFTGNLFAHKKHKHLPPHSEIPTGNSIINSQNIKIDMHTYDYYFNLFTTLISDLPTELQQETIDRAGTVFPYVGKAPGPKGLAEKTLTFYKKLRERYPVVNIILNTIGGGIGIKSNTCSTNMWT